MGLRASTTILGIALFLLSPRPGQAEEAALHTIMQAGRSVVHIEAEAGALEADKPAAFRDPDTGRIRVVRKVRGFSSERTGGGVIIDAGGVILTNAHTVSGAKRIRVTLSDESTAEAEPVYFSPGNDLVFLKINLMNTFTPVAFGDSDALKLDDPVYSIGTSKWTRNSVSGGSVSGLGRQKDSDAAAPNDLLALRFELYQGDSGSPILDRDGAFVGFVMGEPSGSNRTIYAIPSNLVRFHYDQYLKNERDRI